MVQETASVRTAQLAGEARRPPGLRRRSGVEGATRRAMAGRGIAVRRPGCPITGVQESHGLAALLEQAGYRFEQKNGQRVFGPPYFWDGPPPEKGCEVFVANLPRNAFEDELFPLFSRAGTIYQMRLMIDFSGTNRGFGFVQFTSPEEARSAITTVNQLEIRPGVCVRVFKSIDNRRLYVGNIAKEMSAAELTSFFTREVAGVVDVIVYHAINNKSLNRGFVFLEFASHAEAVCARRQLKLTFVQSGHPLVVDWAVPEPEVPDHIMKKVKVLYVRNLLLSTTEFIIWNAMTSIVGNAVVKVKKINDFAFVHFTTRCKAEMALMFWNSVPGAALWCLGRVSG
ncbi:probable RNA-binding protein 46 [Bacillus rossius redtenbacheri]|uniref:probable RNA-binding protein 46 n=1 Tax=Bacillus rossius redtenbacheri TaxID=93214 RepID=UPI002FDD69C5